jgi:hypothetical protein
MWGIEKGMQGQQVNIMDAARELQTKAIIINSFAVIVPLIAVTAIALSTAAPPTKRKRRRRDEEHDDYEEDDRPRRRRSRDEDDEYEEEPPRRRRRRDDDDEPPRLPEDGIQERPRR